MKTKFFKKGCRNFFIVCCWLSNASYLEKQHERHPLVVGMDALFLLIVIAKPWVDDALVFRVWQCEGIRDPAVGIEDVWRYGPVVDT